MSQPVLPIVLGYSRFSSTTALCLDTLLPQAQQLGLEVLTVDNGSPDDSAAQLQTYADASPYHAHLKLRMHSQNLGFGGGMNEAIAHELSKSSTSHPEWLLLINSDTLFPPSSLKAWLASLSLATPDIGIVGPITNNAGNAQKIVLSLRSDTKTANPISSILQEFESWSQAVNSLISQPTGLLWPLVRSDFFCVAIRTSLWRRLEGLDRIYGKGYYEDFDFSMRAASLGFQCALTEDSFIYHQGSATFQANPAQKELIRNNKTIFTNRFPHIKPLHLRQDNLKILQEQLSWLTQQSPPANASTSMPNAVLEALRMRMQIRWQAALQDMPRSPLKRWLWRRKLTKLHQAHPWL